MPIFENPFSLEIPIRIGNLNTIFFINNNLFVNNAECTSYPHSHHDYEIRYLNSGVCNQIINGQSFPLKAGELLLVHPHEYHHQSSNNDSSQYNFRFSVIPPSQTNTSKQKAYDFCISYLSGIRQLKDSRNLLRFYLERLTQEIYRKEDGYNETIRSVCVMIFIEFMRLSDNPLYRLFPPEDSQHSGFIRMRCDEFFREKYLTNVKIGDLAADMNISERQVNRYMHKMFGVSFTRKVIDMRLEKAASLLSETDYPIPKVIQMCGFQNEKYFYQCFKSKFSVSPKQYRSRSGVPEDHPNGETQ